LGQSVPVSAVFAASRLATVVLWVVLVPMVLAVVTPLAGRLLGARRGWLALSVSGVLGSACAIVLAGILTDWMWSSWEMALLSIALAAVLIMIFAVGADLVATPGTLARGERAGLFVMPRPIKDLRARMRPVSRYRELVRIAASNGLLLGSGRGAPSTAAREVRIRRTLEQAGGMFIKLGQVASTRSDLLPASLCAELATLRSAAEPVPAETMRPALEDALGQPVESVFDEFDWQPLGSASIAQVYQARLTTGEAVVVKVRRPGLDELMDRDASALLQVAGMIERRTPLGVSVRPLDLAQEFIDNVDEELDFTVEAANARALVAATPAELRTRVPVVFEQYSSTTVLVEERLIGSSVADVDALRHSGHDPAELADRLLRVMVHHIFEIGVFHADPHPGNVLVLDDGWLGLIDLGAVGRLGPAEQEALRAMLVAMYVGDVSALRATLMDVCIVQPDVQTTLLDSALQQLLSQGIREGGFTGATFEDLVTLVGEYGIRPPRWFATLGRTLITLEGTLHSIDSNFSLVDAVQQQVQSRIAGSHDHEGLREAVQKEALVQLPRLRRLPGRIDELLDQAAAGRLRAGVSIFSDPRDERIVTRLVNRAVLGILAASLAVGSTVLIGVDSGPAFTDSVTLNEVLGYIGLAVGTVLALRVIASIIRDGT